MNEMKNRIIVYGALMLLVLILFGRLRRLIIGASLAIGFVVLIVIAIAAGVFISRFIMDA